MVPRVIWARHGRCGPSEPSLGLTFCCVPTRMYARELPDTVLRDEIELVADLVVAAATASAHLDDCQIDELLGIRPCSQRATA